VRIAGIVLVCAALASFAMAAREAQSEDVPYFLVATPNLSDPIFQESVILMFPVKQPPLVVGLIINKPTTIPVRNLFPDDPAFKDHAETAYFGGPVEPDQAALLMRAAQASGKAMRLFDGIYLSDDPHSAAEMLKDSGSKDLRVFVGRAQWSQEQLQGEKMEGSWYVMPAKPEMLFSAYPGHIWRSLIDRAQLLEVNATGVPAPDALRLLPVRLLQTDCDLGSPDAVMASSCPARTIPCY